MSKKRNSQTTKWIVLAVLAVVLAVLLLVLAVKIAKEKPHEEETGGNEPQSTPQAHTSFVDEPTNSGNEVTTPDVVMITTPAAVPTITVEEKNPGSYEQWLAAAVVQGVYMYYEDAQILEIYLASDTDISAKAESEGVYVKFISEGKELLCQSLPQTGERKTAGTCDIYTAELGYNSFDVVDLATVDIKNMTLVSMADLEMFIDQTVLPTLIIR